MKAITGLRRAVTLAFALLAAAIAPALAQVAPPPAPAFDSARLQTYVDGLVDAAMRTEHVAGAGVVVVKGGEIVLQKGYGQASAVGAPVDPQHTLFRIGSISKTFTWIALMQLVEQRRVNLDNPVNAYLPQPLRVPDDGFEQPIRVRHLLTHTGGFEDLAFGRLFAPRADAAVPLVDALVQQRPHRVRPPGEAAVYSNYGVALAGAIIQQVSGMPFEDYVEEKVLTPLGLQNTTFREPYTAALAHARGLPSPMSPDLQKDVSEGFRFVGGRFAPQPFEYVVQYAPAGSVSATPADMGRYLIALKSGLPSILKPETAALFARPQPLFANAPGLNGLAYGMLQNHTPDGWRGWGHGGDTLWFHSAMAIYPELDLGVFVTTNSEQGGGLRDLLPARIADTVGRQLGLSPSPLTATSAKSALPLARFAGVYLSERRAYTTAERFACLINCAVTVAEDKGALIVGGGERAARLAPFDVVDRGHGLKTHRFRNVASGELSGFDERNGEILRYLGAGGVNRADRVSAFAGPSGFFIIVGLGALGALAAFLSGVSRLLSRGQPGPAARLAGLVLPLAGLVWLAALSIMTAYALGAADNPWIVFTDWPGAMRAGTTLAAVGAGLTGLGALAVGAAWFAADWSAWRRARLVATIVSMAAMGFMLHAWNLIAPNF